MREQDVPVKNGHVAPDAPQERGQPSIQPPGHHARWEA